MIISLLGIVFYLLLFLIPILIIGLTIIAMCMIASNADEITDEWLENNEKGRFDDEDEDTGSQRFSSSIAEVGQDD